MGGGYCRLQMPLQLALGIRGTVAGHRPGALEGGGVPPPLPVPGWTPPPLKGAPPVHRPPNSPPSSRRLQSYAPMLQGDLLALLTSVAVTLLLPLSKRLQARTPPLLLLTAMMALASGLTLGFAWLCLGATLTPDPWRGLGGLAAPAWAVSVWGGALLMLVGWAGCVVVTRYVNPVVVSSFMALEPCCAVALGLLLRVAPAPGPATAAGGLLMVAATVLVSLSSRDEDDGQLVPLVLDDVHGRAAGEREVVAAAAEALCNPRFVEQR